MGWEETYRKKTPLSRNMFERSAGLHVNGVSHNIRFFEPYPFVTASSHGKSLVDVDSNSYTDYWMGHWALVLGHRHPAVEEALASQVSRGWMYGTVNEQTIELSQMISDAIPAAERIRYTVSGTEAVMYAARLARAATGRDVIAKVDGGWHGYASDMLKTVNWPFSEPESTGCIHDDRIVSIPYNDTERAVSMLEGVGDRLAGIVVEPVLGGAGCIPARADYLRGLQECARKSGALFVLDEIVTGFRFGYGCMYGEMGLDPDLLTLGKIVGGGMPLGVLCGKEEIMEIANAKSMSRQERCYIGGGTFSANPASMVAGAATLRTLKESPATYERINKMGGDARASLGRILEGRAQVTGRGSLFMTHFTESGPVVDAAGAAGCNHQSVVRYHMHIMAHDGIFILPGKLGAFSSAHTPDDVRDLAGATERFAAGDTESISPASPQDARERMAREAIAKFRSL